MMLREYDFEPYPREYALEDQLVGMQLEVTQLVGTLEITQFVYAST